MKVVGSMSAKLLQNNFSPQTGITRIWKHRMIIGMPIYIQKQLPFTKTFTTTLKQSQLIESLAIFP